MYERRVNVDGWKEFWTGTGQDPGSAKFLRDLAQVFHNSRFQFIICKQRARYDILSVSFKHINSVSVCPKT